MEAEVAELEERDQEEGVHRSYWQRVAELKDEEVPEPTPLALFVMDGAAECAKDQDGRPFIREREELFRIHGITDPGLLGMFRTLFRVYNNTVAEVRRKEREDTD